MAAADGQCWKAACKCGEVEFEFTSPPMFSNGCCCCDCVSAAFYVDGKAKEAGVENLSSLEDNNPQSALNVVFAPSCIRLVKGRDKIAFYRMKEKTNTMRTYTTCCYTTVCSCAGDTFMMAKGGISFNPHTVTPFPKTTYRCMAHRAQRPLPQDNIKPYQVGPWKVLGQVMKIMTIGTGGPSKDKVTHEFINYDSKKVTEVAGKPAYDAAGFKDEYP